MPQINPWLRSLLSAETIRMDYSTLVSRLDSSKLNDIAQEFETAWQARVRNNEGALPEIDNYLRDVGERRSTLLVLLPIDMEYRLKLNAQQAEAYGLEDYVARFEELRPLASLPFDLVAWECLLAFDHADGTQPDLQAYISKYPSYAERLQQLFAEFGVNGEGEHDRHGTWAQHATRGQVGRLGQTDSANTEANHSDISARYVKLRDHAEGGLGRVTLALDRTLRREVAMKEIKEHFADLQESRQRFVFEAEITGRLEHPGIVPVYDLRTDAAGRPSYVMRFISGTALDQEIKPLAAIEDRLTWERRVRDLVTRMVSVCNTIEYAHQRKVLHRDLKPANILLGPFGETLVVDWGLAKQLGADAPELVKRPVPVLSAETQPTPAPVVRPDIDASLIDTHAESSLHETIETPALPKPAAHLKQLDVSNPNTPKARSHTSAGSVFGTPHYMPPEQAEGDIASLGPAADIYSLGATLYHLVCGQPPFGHVRGRSVSELLEEVKLGKVVPPRTVQKRVPKALEAIILKAMQQRPEDRYPSAKALALDLENFLADDPVTAMPESWTRHVSRWLRRHRTLAMTIGVSLIAIASVATIALLITNRALSRSEHLRAIATIEQRFDQRLGAEETRRLSIPVDVIVTPLDDRLINASLFDLRELDQLIGRGDEVRDTESRRERLLNLWADSIERFARSNLTDDRQSELDAAMHSFTSGYPWRGSAHNDQTARLSLVLQQRALRWQPVKNDGLPSPDFVADGAGWRRNVLIDDQWISR